MIDKQLFLIKKGYTDFKPFESKKLRKITIYQVKQRMVDNPDKLIGRDNYTAKNWFKGGENHRLVDGIKGHGDKKWITRDDRVEGWVMECDIKDIMKLTECPGVIHIENYADEYKQLDGSDLPVIRLCEGYECE